MTLVLPLSWILMSILLTVLLTALEVTLKRNPLTLDSTFLYLYSTKVTVNPPAKAMRCHCRDEKRQPVELVPACRPRKHQTILDNATANAKEEKASNRSSMPPHTSTNSGIATTTTTNFGIVAPTTNWAYWCPHQQTQALWPRANIQQYQPRGNINSMLVVRWKSNGLEMTSNRAETPTALAISKEIEWC